MAGSPLKLSVAPSFASSASQGGDLWDTGSQFQFGDHIAGDGSGGAANSPFSGLVRDLAIGVAVSLLAKYAWNKIK
ncbi:MAG: hypothetical protein GQ535_11115 [Rhodobacteraceae bacterium]|nr:hypothetical protein [Paracoccaceae bacterium]